MSGVGGPNGPYGAASLGGAAAPDPQKDIAQYKAYMEQIAEEIGILTPSWQSPTAMAAAQAKLAALLQEIQTFKPSDPSDPGVQQALQAATNFLSEGQNSVQFLGMLETNPHTPNDPTVFYHMMQTQLSQWSMAQLATQITPGPNPWGFSPNDPSFNLSNPAPALQEIIQELPQGFWGNGFNCDWAGIQGQLDAYAQSNPGDPNIAAFQQTLSEYRFVANIVSMIGTGNPAQFETMSEVAGYLPAFGD